MREAIAQAYYERNPFYAPGEFIDGFQVSPGGTITWRQAQQQDAEFGDDPLFTKITAEPYEFADRILALLPSTPTGGGGEWVTLSRKNLATMEEQRRRIRRWNKSTEELDTDILQTRVALDDLTAAPQAPYGWVPTHRHLKRGTEYAVIGEAELQLAGQFGPTEGDSITVYRGADGKLWARATSEFEDGRFDPLPQPPAPGSGK